jgi:hypothetical protein
MNYKNYLNKFGFVANDRGGKNNFRIRSVLDVKIQRLKIKKFVDESDLIFSK